MTARSRRALAALAGAALTLALGTALKCPGPSWDLDRVGGVASAAEAARWEDLSAEGARIHRMASHPEVFILELYGSDGGSRTVTLAHPAAP